MLLLITSAEGGYVLTSVCLSLCLSDNWKSCERILTKFLGWVGHGPGTNEFNFGDDPDHRPDPEVRNPHSLDCRKSYQWILMKFYGELGCGLETNWLHPDHHPDPGVWSLKSRFTGLSTMLAFGGGLCSLNTSSFTFRKCGNSLWLFCKMPLAANRTIPHDYARLTSI